MLIRITLLQSVHADFTYIKFCNRENWSSIYSGKKNQNSDCWKGTYRTFWDDGNIQYLAKGLG